MEVRVLSPDPFAYYHLIVYANEMKETIPKPWHPSENEVLLELISKDMSFRKISEIIGRSRNACIGKMHRLAQQMEPRE